MTLPKDSGSPLHGDSSAAVAENQRLRDLYENAVGNRERFGWTINHLLECEEALRTVEAERDRLRKAVFTVRHMIDPHNPCHDGMREALLDALAER